MKKPPVVDSSRFPKKTDSATLKWDVDDLNIDKLKTGPVDLSKLSNVVDNDSIQKTVYDKLVTKVDSIDTSTFVLKTQYNTDKSGLKKKIGNADKKYLKIVYWLKNNL